MRQNRRRMLSVMTIPLIVVLGISLCSTALAQETLWKALSNQFMELYQKGK